ncbi:UNVERIFIED_CONTAM: hypothetical protein FKN15_039637 [Acipenser sinensis]
MPVSLQHVKDGIWKYNYLEKLKGFAYVVYYLPYLTTSEGKSCFCNQSSF